jgi:hypothetical protein
MISRKDLSILIPVDSEEGIVQIAVPDVPIERVNNALPVLGHIFSESQKCNYAPIVFIRDYDFYVHQACKFNAVKWSSDPKEQKAIETKLYEDFSAFVQVAFVGATVINSKLERLTYPEFMAKIPEEQRSEAEGYFVFFYARLRYSLAKTEELAKEDWIVSCPITEYIKRLMISSSKEKTSSKTEEAL